MIMQLVPAYVKATQSNHSYRVIRSFVVNGHEVAWVEVTYFLNSDAAHNQPLQEYRVMCDCDFIEGIGWNIDGCGRIYTVHGRDANACETRPVVMEMRRQELQNHLERVADKPEDGDSKETVLYVVRAIEVLATFAQHHVMIEAGTGAGFWGGYFYLQTVQQILDIEWPIIHTAMAVLYKREKLDLNGMVVIPYTTPPEPKWTTYDIVDIDKYSLKRCLPSHDRMPHAWKLSIYETSSNTLLQERQLQITQPLEWGVDIEDLAGSEAELKRMLLSLQDQSS